MILMLVDHRSLIYTASLVQVFRQLITIERMMPMIHTMWRCDQFLHTDRVLIRCH